MRLTTLWHYGVFKGGYFFEPACVSDALLELDHVAVGHGLTINRGDVNCPNCKRMMGMI